ncbi:MAG: hypothetical protein JWO82_2327 [Akkermansiaceae bacterium]|nr:hypothetical protein [Akkermansiaceae bacterium]
MRRWMTGIFVLWALVVPAWAAAPIPARRVVFVHGIWQNEWRCFGVIRRALEERGVECLAPSLRPSDGRNGLPDEAAQLKAAIDQRFGPKDHFVIIAFSMGGLASRYYLQEMGGAKRCDGFFTVSTPHQGTRIAYFYPGKGARDMRPGSAFLKELGESEDRLGKIPIVSYGTKADMVVPYSRSVWKRAENVPVKCSMHRLMTACPGVRDDILRRLRTPLQPARG